MKYEPNPDFEKQLKQQLTQTVQQVFDEVSRTHNQHDETDVRAALKAAAQRHGINDWAPPDEAVKAISEGRQVKAR